MSNIDNPMDRLNGLTERVREAMGDLGFHLEHIAFTPSAGAGGQHMAQMVLRIEPAALMEEDDQDDVDLSDTERDAFEALMSGAAQVDSSEVDRDKAVDEVKGWLEGDL